MAEIKAYKMDGLGNDFVIIDRRKVKIDLSKEQIINIADRKKGPGCDQIIIIDKDKLFVLLFLYNKNININLLTTEIDVAV